MKNISFTFLPLRLKSQELAVFFSWLDGVNLRHRSWQHTWSSSPSTAIKNCSKFFAGADRTENVRSVLLFLSCALRQWVGEPLTPSPSSSEPFFPKFTKSAAISLSLFLFRLFFSFSALRQLTRCAIYRPPVAHM